MNPRTSRAQKQPTAHEMEGVAQVWHYLVDSGNIQPKNYDGDLVLQLCSSLRITGDVTAFITGSADFGRAMEDHHISREDFVHALFSAAQPFAEMMAQLCSFFERHAVRGTGDALRMKFDFDGAGKELTFDLKHFREWLRDWDTVEGIVESDCWDTSTLWDVVYAISPQINREAKIDNTRAQEWIAANGYPGRETAPNHWASPPRPPATGTIEIDRAVRRIFAAVSAVSRSCVSFGTYAELAAESNAQVRRAPTTGGIAGQSGSPAPVVEWHIRSLHLLESDYFLAALMRALWNWVEELLGIRADARLNAAQPTLLRLEKLFGSIATKPAPGEIDLERLLSFLRLPVWKERPALYAAWMLPVIEQSLAEYPVQIHDEDGTLRFSFSATQMATFKSSAGDITLVAEHRAPLDNPTGEGRKSHAQPDYVLFVGNRHNPEDAKVVLELKQYLRPSVKKFGAALVDYTRAFTNADVLLADYGPMSPAVMTVVPDILASRSIALGDVRPGREREILELQQRIRQALPPAPAVGRHQAPVAVKTILVDVSGSMRERLVWQAVRDHLRDLAKANPASTWVAVDTQVRATLTGPDALEKLLALEMSNSTELSQIVATYRGNDTIVITDEDGEKQLRDQGPSLKRIGLANSNGIEWLGSTG